MAKKLIILDYSTGVTHIFDDPQLGQSENYEDWMDEEGFRVSDCSWMVTNEIRII